ncbi:MAG: pyridoxine 5'-phosphate synthase [Salibacteraceae bacterium]
MTRLSVNINKIATLRNARGGNVPNVLEAARRIEEFGADGITVHPRPDERHIRYKDVIELSTVVTTEFNIEGFPSEKWMELVASVKPTQATLVPDAPDAITSNAGWNTVRNKEFLTSIVKTLKDQGIRVSIFVDADPEMIRAAAETQADRIELYTGPYANDFSTNRHKAIEPYRKAANTALDCGLGINAGHDLNLANLEFFCKTIGCVDEVSIGHALICDALYLGLENTVQLYRSKLQ